MRPYFRSYALLGLLLRSCVPENPPQEANELSATKHDLGPITMQIPRGWKRLDYDSSGLADGDQAPSYRQRYLFLNVASRDTAFRESIILTVDKRPGTFHVAKAREKLADYLHSIQNQIQVLMLRDTLLENGHLAILEVSARNRAQHLDFIQTSAFYTKPNVNIIFMGSAMSHPGSTDQQTRVLFRQAIHSITWK